MVGQKVLSMGLLAVMLASAMPVQAGTITYAKATGFWSQAGTWSNGVPGATYDAVWNDITAEYNYGNNKVTYDAGVTTITSLQIGGKTSAAELYFTGSATTKHLTVTNLVRLGKESGSYGTLNMNSGTLTFNGTGGASTFVIGGRVAATTGVLNLNGTATLNMSDNSGGMILGYVGGTGLSSATINIGGGVLNTPGFVTYATAATAINLSSGGKINFTANGAVSDVDTFALLTGGGALSAKEGFSGTINSSITGAGPLQISGSGTIALNAVNAYTGATLIHGGTLSLGNAGTIDNSTTITVGDAGSSNAVLDLKAKTAGFAFLNGQTLEGVGQVSLLNDQALTVNGVLSPGNSGSSVGSLTIAGDLVLGGTAATNLTINGWNSGDYDLIKGSDALGEMFTAGGVLNVAFGSSVTVGSAKVFDFDSYGIADFSTVKFDLGSQNTSFSALYDKATGIVSVSAIPEPSAIVLMSTAMIVLIAYAWRKRK